jgi:hypothetical protein
MRWRVSATGTPVFPRTGGAWEWDPLTELLFGAAVASIFSSASCRRTVVRLCVGEERGLVEDDTAAVMEVEDQGRLGGGVSTTAGAADTRTRDGRAWGSHDSGRRLFFFY